MKHKYKIFGTIAFFTTLWGGSYILFISSYNDWYYNALHVTIITSGIISAVSVIYGLIDGEGR